MSPAGCSAACPARAPAARTTHSYESTDGAGNEVWTCQAGGPGHDLASTVAVDAAGDVYVAGQRDVSSNDVGTTVVRKYRPDGTELWTRQQGETDDVTIAVTIDSAGAVYQVGELAPAQRVHDHAQGNHRGVPFVRKYNPNGTEAWTRPFGAGATDASVQVAVDSAGTVYVAGHTSRGTRIRRARPPIERLRAHVRSRWGAGGHSTVRRRRVRNRQRRLPSVLLASSTPSGGHGRAGREGRQRAHRCLHRQGQAVVATSSSFRIGPIGPILKDRTVGTEVPTSIQ